MLSSSLRADEYDLSRTSGRGAGADASRSAGEEAFIASGDGSLGGSGLAGSEPERATGEIEVQVEPWLLHGRMERRYRTRLEGGLSSKSYTQNNVLGSEVKAL